MGDVSWNPMGWGIPELRANAALRSWVVGFLNLDKSPQLVANVQFFDTLSNLAESSQIYSDVSNLFKLWEIFPRYVTSAPYPVRSRPFLSFSKSLQLSHIAQSC